MKTYNAKRKGHAFPKNVDEAYRGWIRALPCILAGRTEHCAMCAHRCSGLVRVCHVKSRGAGGADRNNVYAGCDAAHEEQHAIGIAAFQKRWGVDLKATAQQLTQLYESERWPCP